MNTQESIERKSLSKIKNKKVSSSKSIRFSWNHEEFDSLLRTCNSDDGVVTTLNFLKNKKVKILEAGCGLGRVVKHLYNLGYKKVSGIEIDKASVKLLNSEFPELDIISGDITNLPYKKNSFDVVLSYGVIEHFPEGPHNPLISMRNVLKSDGIVIVTVPSFNVVRQIQYFFSLVDPRRNNFIRRLFGEKQLDRNCKRFSWYIEPQYGNFFEYRFTPKQFKNILKKAGFEIILSRPIAHADGLFHCFGPPLIYFKDWKFTFSRLGAFLNSVFSFIPFFHNHMHLCVVKKIK
ncbi:MAG: class I SAM-dependent methyltransferase [Actinobacteria bacterium]|nr:class I SAM-dependent methyltransferase [Actinomycetota bacterium]